MKKTLSMLLALIMVLSLMAPGLTVLASEPDLTDGDSEIIIVDNQVSPEEPDDLENADAVVISPLEITTEPAEIMSTSVAGPLGDEVTEPYYWVEYEYSLEKRTITFTVSLYNNPGISGGYFSFYYLGIGTYNSGLATTAAVVGNASVDNILIDGPFSLNRMGGTVQYKMLDTNESGINDSYNGELFTIEHNDSIQCTTKNKTEN